MNKFVKYLLSIDILFVSILNHILRHQMRNTKSHSYLFSHPKYCRSNYKSVGKDVIRRSASKLRLIVIPIGASERASAEGRLRNTLSTHLLQLDLYTALLAERTLGI